MLGRHRPGSEGNLASDLENQDPAVTTAANGDPEVTNSETESAKSGAVKDAAPGKEAAFTAPLRLEMRFWPALICRFSWLVLAA